MIIKSSLISLPVLLMSLTAANKIFNDITSTGSEMTEALILTNNWRNESGCQDYKTSKAKCKEEVYANLRGIS